MRSLAILSKQLSILFNLQRDALPVRAGQVYKRFVAKDGRTGVVLRAAKWEDLDDMMEFANGLAAEHLDDINFGVLLSKRVTRDEEAEWLAKKLVRIEQGTEVSVVAQVKGRMVGNSEVVRGSLDDVSSHGRLGIAIAKDYRGIGIGTEMLTTLIRLSKEAGMKTLELEVLSTNPKATALYQRVGFERAGVLKGKIRRQRGKVIDGIIMTRDLE